VFVNKYCAYLESSPVVNLEDASREVQKRIFGVKREGVIE
jgi:hypothetical protein